MQDRQTAERRIPAWGYLLLAIPFVAVLWVPFYSSTSPDVAGIPYFYWYQFLWVVISGILTAIVYLATSGGRAASGDEMEDDVRRSTRD